MFKRVSVRTLIFGDSSYVIDINVDQPLDFFFIQ